MTIVRAQHDLNQKDSKRPDILICWLFNNNVPDSIISHKPPGHIASFKNIDSIFHRGIRRKNRTPGKGFTLEVEMPVTKQKK
jgi:hypothetical protein